jgi:PAS domain S-box-containing protein
MVSRRCKRPAVAELINSILPSDGAVDMTPSALPQQEALTGITQRRFALLLSILLIGAGVAMTPFANQPLLPIPGYMTAFGAAMLAINSMLAMLLYNRGASEHHGHVVTLGTAYFFVAMIFLPLMAAFPGGLMTGSIIGNGVSSVWIWSFWHAGFGLLILRFARAAKRCQPKTYYPLREALITLIVIVVLTLIATVGAPYLPSLYADGHRFFSGTYQIIPWSIMVIDAYAAVLLIRLPTRTPEQLWLTVGMLAACFDVWLTFHGTDRFSLGWYVSKLGSLFTSMAVLVSLFSDLTMLYRRVADHAYFLRTITNNIPALIAYVDSNEVYQFCNRAYDTIMGIDHRTMIGKSICEVIGQESYDKVQPYISQVLAGKQVRFEREGLESGSLRHFMCHYIPDIAPDKSVRGFHLMVMDISERKTAELIQARSEKLAEAANRAKSEFVANMSHEIRTPMNAVLGVTQLLERTRLTAEQSKYLNMIRHSGSALLTIINDILDFSKIEAGKLSIVSAPFDLGGVLDTVASVMTINVGTKKIELIIGVQPDVPQQITGDAMRLQQALINLVSNALKFTAEGEISVKVSVSASRDSQVTLRFDVRDTGIGLSQEQLTRLFTPFEQADSTTSRRFGGTGLGLIISRRLIELMGGAIEVDSVPGQGSVFSIIAPFTVSYIDAVAARRRLVNLVVLDDNATTRECLVDIAIGLGWRAQSAMTMQQAIALAESSSTETTPVQLILFDQKIQQSEDFDTLITYAQQNAIRLIMTCNASSAEATDETKFADMLLKPVTPAALLGAVNKPVETQAGIEALQDDLSSLHMEVEAGLVGINILLVEDNQTNVIVAQGMLEPLGVNLIYAENGAVAVEMLRSDTTQFDLVLMDIQMPVMDGFAATEIIRNELKMSLPILAMTAGVLESERAQCLAAGMNDVIAKPIDFARATATILHYVGA